MRAEEDTVNFRLEVLEQPEQRTPDFAEHLARRLQGVVQAGRHQRLLYATDASIYQVAPLAVVIPRGSADVVETLRFAAEWQLPILPRGAGTSLAGQAVNRALSIDFSTYCNRFLSLDEAESSCTVEPGIVLDHLNQALAEQTGDRLMFGPDVATSTHATLGGMIGNNSAGAHSVLYGRTVSHVKGVRAILADATVLDFYENAAADSVRIRELTEALQQIILPLAAQIEREYPKLARGEGGYNLPLLLEQFRESTPGSFDRVNLAQFLVGTEGTLAVTLAAELRLVAKPAEVGLAVLSFSLLDDAIGRVPEILATTDPSAVELLDNSILNLAKQNPPTQSFLKHLPGAEDSAGLTAVLYVEYFADSPAVLAEKFQRLADLLPKQLPRAFHFEPAAIREAWQLRKAAEPLLHSIPGPRKPIGFVEDTAVPPARLPEFIKRFRAIVSRYQTTASYYAHASVGCLHIRPLLNLTDPVDLNAMREISTAVAQLVAEFEGSFSGEHGYGRARSALLGQRFSPPILNAFQEIKKLFDPARRLNPGNLVAPLPITENLRIVPGGPRQCDFPAVETFFDYEVEGGFSAALESCNGAALCRRDAPGVMCPSFRATREERHSTRGRANALRLALTGQFDPQQKFADPETLQTLGRCLACKACKAECPSNVDLAKYKAEYLAQSFKQECQIPLAAKLLGQIQWVNRIGSALAPAANIILNLAPVRALVQRVLDFSPARRLPEFAPSFQRWLRSFPQPVGRDAPVVVLYADCFTNYQEPEIARAVVFVLNALGYRIQAPSIPCCGRAMISQGLLADAQRQVSRAAKALFQAVQKYNAAAIIVCEPSCLASIKDEWLTLKTDGDTTRLRVLAKMAHLPEEFLAEAGRLEQLGSLCKSSNNNNEAEVAPQTISWHEHCHQRALGCTEATLKVLRQVTAARGAGCRIEVIPATCCGMAGAFGYTRAHYDLSMQIGELALFPAIRQLGRDDLVLTAGTSCRQQIKAGTQRRAQHPIEFIAETLGLLPEHFPPGP